LSLTGNVSGAGSKEKIPFASIFIREPGKHVSSDSSGDFRLDSLCPGAYTLMITATGYDSLVRSFRLEENTNLSFILKRDAGELATVEVLGEKKQDIATNAKSELKGLALFQTAGQTLGESLKNIPGLNSIQTGPSISKPVIHGLHSNRILILNNGVRQEGQQWGSEHAPEIDPFISDKVTIIKGAASVRYGSDAIVGVLLVEPKPLAPEKPFQGELNLVAGTNGRMGAVSSLLEGKIKKMAGINWRVQGTLKEAGNFRTSSYFLENTGLAEKDFSLAANYRNKKKNFGVEAYYSEFHNQVGIFSGSHVGNVNDLYATFQRSRPITPSYFSYKIGRTYQQITHDLLKLSSYYKFKNGNRLEVQYSSQKNKRDEYDIDYPYTTDPNILKLPQISFQIRTQSLDIIYRHSYRKYFTGLAGISGFTQGNVFRGIRYLVPNFRNYNGGAFVIERYSKNRWLLEAGLRYDYSWLRVYRINNTSLETYHNTSEYRNATGTAGATYNVSSRFSVSTNIGTAWRAPSVNELYINGIHLSAASYEKGDSTLRSERSYNFTVSGKYQAERFFTEIVLYDNIINGFIYAKPSLTPITLISGTYPLFNYTQANAELKGLDAEINFKLTKKLSYDGRASIVRAWNKTIHDHLIFMPADRFSNTLRYEPGQWGKSGNWYVSAELLTVLRQSRTPPNSDYVDPPPGYNLVNANLGFELPVKKNKLNLELAGYNLTNTAYRDYLNRFRYYADDLGINIVLRARLTF
jgi:iron complex outermembrane receptor protein